MTGYASIWALPLIPGVAALAGFLLPLKARRIAAGIAIAGTGGALLAVFGNLGRLLPAPDDAPAAIVSGHDTFVHFGDVAVRLSVGLNSFTWWVAVLVGLVALLVQVYSVGYLADDERYVPYAAQVTLFTAAMMLVVVSDDLVLLLIGWEVMGACSYLLIGHDRRLPEAPGAAVKAFLVTRVGDVGFLLGILLLGFHSGSFRFDEVLAHATGGAADPAILTAAALLIILGAIGKSAQFPLHTWLPDAMAGPTPISALIHAATMVAAGAFVLVRLSPLLLSAGVRPVLGAIAMVSMVLAAFVALAVDDLKRVLAWSTVSQVAYMMAAVSIGDTRAAVFHLVGHGLFKALLFLGAGAVIHMAGTNAMTAMGGLRRGAPVTFWTMTIGFAALIGLPPLTGFYSKEHVLSGIYVGGQPLLFAFGLLTAFLTAAYATRAWLRVFFGKTRTAGVTAHDPGWWMRTPLLVLTVPTVLLGITVTFGGGNPLVKDSHTNPSAMAFAMTAILAGVGLMWALWREDKAADPARALGPLRMVFARAFYLDELQHLLVVRPVRLLARAARRVDLSVVDGAAEGTGRGVGLLGGLVALRHRAGMPRQVLSVLVGALVIGLAVAAIGVWA